MRRAKEQQTPSKIFVIGILKGQKHLAVLEDSSNSSGIGVRGNF